MMSVDDPYTELPDDPEGAFVHLEKHYRQALHEKLEASQSGNAGDSYWIEYMNRTLAAAQELGISALAEWTVPSHTDTSSRIYDRWQNFTTAVENYTTRLAIKNSRRQRSHSIAFDHATKQKIRHYLDKIKEIVDNLRISEQKKEKIYARINALADEVDRNRTRFDAAMALSVEAASTGGTAFNKLRPALDSITRLFGKAKAEEDQSSSLLALEHQKRIEPPRFRPAAPATESGPTEDEEIPF